MQFFDKLKAAPPDAILGLSAAFKADTRTNKVNLGVGAYKTDALQPLVLSAVRKAEQQIVTAGMDKEYLLQEGNAEYLQHTSKLVFGDNMPPSFFAAQSPGGTAAVRIAAELLVQAGYERIYVPDPTWANHAQIFGSVGLSTATYPYYDATERALDFGAMLNAIATTPAGSPILLHACCHNPTGLDPTAENWNALSDAIQAQGLLPVFDFAYQGFGDGIDADATAVRHFLAAGHEMLVATSYSKNFGLYGERVGAFFVVTHDAESADRIGSQVKRLIRANYSNPPVHGSRLVAKVLASSELRREWELELSQMRERISGMRRALADRLKAAGGPVDFGFMYRQKGMFSYSGLSRAQVEMLREKYAIYMPGNGRINVAGLSPKNLDYVVQAILSVLPSN